MTGWGAGYVTEVDYTYGYFRELAPTIHRFALICASIRPPSAPKLGAFRYLELGYGQGVSLNIHAAACPGEFWGTDFNPAQAAAASEIARAAGSDARILDDSFEELLGRDDLPQFDAVVMHGIWTWVSAENRAIVVKLLRRCVRPGGVVYVSYNTKPGWSGSAGLRDLFKLHVECATRPHEGVLAHMDAAISFARRVQDADARFFLMNPDAAERLKRIDGKNKTYLTHEYLNEEWHPMAVWKAARELEPAKLTLAATVDLLQAFDGMHVGEKGMAILAELRDPIVRESVRDYLVNQVFRRDLFVRGLRRMDLHERAAELGRQRFVLLCSVQDISLVVQAARGEVKLAEDLYRPVVEALAGDRGSPKSLSDLETILKSRGLDAARITEAIVMLVGTGQVSPAQDDRVIEQVSSRCRALNRYLCELAPSRGDIEFLASPVVGHGVPVGRVEQLFLLARASKAKTAEDVASYVWRTLGPQGQRLMRDGKVVENEAENLALFVEEAKKFLENRLPVLTSLNVVI